MKTARRAPKRAGIAMAVAVALAAISASSCASTNDAGEPTSSAATTSETSAAISNAQQQSTESAPGSGSMATAPSQESSPDRMPAGAGIDPVVQNDEARSKLPGTIIKRGVLRIALTNKTPPSGFMAPDGKTVVGVDADMAVLLGQELGLKVEMFPVEFDQIIAGIAANRYDMTIAAMSPTDERMKVLDFVDYFRTGTNIAVPPGNPENLTIESLCGHTVAVLKGSVQEATIVPGWSDDCTADGKDPIVIKSFPDQQSTVLAVTAKRVDAAAQSAPPLAWAKKQGAPIELGQQDTWTTVALGIKKNSGLLDGVHLATQDILDKPSYEQLLNKWGVADCAISKAAVNNKTY